jgi:hypothetical protein
MGEILPPGHDFKFVFLKVQNKKNSNKYIIKIQTVNIMIVKARL